MDQHFGVFQARHSLDKLFVLTFLGICFADLLQSEACPVKLDSIG